MTGKATGTNQKLTVEHLTTNYVNWQQVSNMTENERSVSDVKMDRGSTNCI